MGVAVGMSVGRVVGWSGGCGRSVACSVGCAVTMLLATRVLAPTLVGAMAKGVGVLDVGDAHAVSVSMKTKNAKND